MLEDSLQLDLKSVMEYAISVLNSCLIVKNTHTYTEETMEGDLLCQDGPKGLSCKNHLWLKHNTKGEIRLLFFFPERQPSSKV